MQLAQAKADGLPSHPAADIFPLMSQAELSVLADDIRKNGQHEAIVTIDGAILDGRNRWLACGAAHVVPVTVEWDRRGSPLDYVVSANLYRRHLNVTQRAMIGGRMANMRREDNLLRGPDVQKDTSEDRNEKVSLQQAADVMGVGRVYISHARTVLEHGTPEEIATADRGERGVSTLATEIRKRKQAARADNVVQLPVTPRPIGRPPQKIKLPTGKTPEMVAREAAALREKLPSVGEVAQAVGVRAETCRMMIDIVLIADRVDLSQRDTAVARRALNAMNEQSMRLANIHATIKPIMRSIWGDRRGSKLSSAREASRLERFEHGLGMLTQSCKNGTQMEVPHLSPERARDAVHELHQSITSIKVLISKLEGMHQ